MNISAVGTAALPQAPTAPAATLTVLGGEVATALTTGQALQATVRPAGTDPRQLLLDLPGEASLLVLSSEPLEPGQLLTLRVRAVHPQVQFDAFPRPAVLAPQPSITVPALTLQPGQQLAVQVLGESAASPGRTVVAIAGTPVEAVTPEPYPPGSTLRVEVVRTQPELHLRAIQLPTADASVSSALLRDRLPVPSLADAVAPLLAPEAAPPEQAPHLQELVTRLRTLLPERAPPNAAQLEQFIRDGGLHYEPRLLRLAEPGALAEEVRQLTGRDLKGLALAALAEQAPEGAPPTERAALLEQYLRTIEVQQTANLLAQARGDPIFLQVPVFFSANEPATLHLAVQPDVPGRAREGQPGGHTLLMHLDLPGLGGVRIDSYLPPAAVGGGLRVALYAESEAGKAQIQSELHQLRDALRGLGLGPVELAVREWRQLPEEHQPTFHAMLQGLPRSGPGLDVRA